MYLCKALTNASLPEIGKSFGGKHHSTVIHSIRKVEDMRQHEPAFNTLINTLSGSHFAEGFAAVFHSARSVDRLWSCAESRGPDLSTDDRRNIRRASAEIVHTLSY